MRGETVEPDRHAPPSYASARAHFREHGQDHVFQFWPRLSSASRARLLAQAASLDLAELARLRASALAPRPAHPAPEPAPVTRLPAHGGDPAAWREAREAGRQLLAEGRVAALTMAGGQGTRLGLAGPKGTIRLGPVSDRSLFEIHARKLLGLRRRYGRAVPWYVMTSPDTDAPTRAFFAEHGCFGLPAEDVVFFPQATLPALDLDGRLLLAAPDRIFESPDGHGGCLTALRDAGALGDLRARGVDTLFSFQVDNPLVRVAEPDFLGHRVRARAEMASKVIARTSEHDRMGVPVREGAALRVIEYSELPASLRTARDEAGGLRYWAGSHAVHAFTLPFLERLAPDAESLLPVHAALKKVPWIDEDGRRHTPREPNGHKLERFVFDALPHTERALLVEGMREDEYAPLKNSDAEGGECPARARAALSDRARRWLGGAGVALPPGGGVELDPALADGPEDLRGAGIKSVEDARGAIQVAPEVVP